jgi:molybdopterin synthase sulfur carrier subunit
MTEVRLPSALVRLFPGTPRRLDLSGATVREVLAALDQAVPGMHDRLLTAGPEIREHVRVFVDGEQAGLDTPVAPRSLIDVVLAVSGG